MWSIISWFTNQSFYSQTHSVICTSLLLAKIYFGVLDEFALIFKDVQIRDASTAARMLKMAFWMAMIFFEIRNTYRVSPKGVYSSIKIIFFHQTVPLSTDDWLPIALRRFLYPMRYLHTALLLVNFMSLTSTALVALRLYLPGEVHVQKQQLFSLFLDKFGSRLINLNSFFLTRIGLMAKWWPHLCLLVLWE